MNCPENNRPALRLSELVGFYLAVFLLYTLIPDPLQPIKPVLSGLLLVTLAAIFGIALNSLKRDRD